MAIGQWLVTALAVGVALELWTGTAFIPWSVHRGGTPRNTDHVIHKDEFELGYWLAIGLHSAMLLFCWWRAVG